MHIGIDATALYGRYNGVEYALWNGLRALAELRSKHFYSVWIPEDGPGMAELESFGSRWRWHRLPFPGSNKLRRIAWQQTLLPRLLKRQTCDVLYAPTYVSPIRASVPVVLGVYDLIALDSPEFATRANRLHYRAVLPAALRGAACVIVPTPAVAAKARRFSNQVRVVPLSVDVEFRPAGEAAVAELRGRLGLPDEYLLFVGNREPKKNLPRLLAAMELLAEEHAVPPVVIAGEARAWGEAMAVPAKIQLIRLGYVPRADLPVLMSACTAFLFPSLAEGFGLPVLEALACGAPVVASTAVPIPQLHRVTVMCDPLSVPSIAAAVELMLGDAEFRAGLALRAPVFAASYSARSAAEATLSILEEVAKGSFARPASNGEAGLQP